MLVIGPRTRDRAAKLTQLDRQQRRVRAGASQLDELVEATGWLPHTTRAALTGLRKRGYEVSIDRSDREHGSRYRIGAKPSEKKEETEGPVEAVDA